MNISLRAIRRDDLRLDHRNVIGQGGEAEIYDVGRGLVAKIFKQPDHPDYSGNYDEQKAVRARLAEYRFKLTMLPSSLPERVICPESLVIDNRGEIAGYLMRKLDGVEPLMRYGERSFRQTGISNGLIADIFRDLHRIVSGLHGYDVVIGDFNDLNVLVRENEAWLIDIDSVQFGSFYCRMFTGRFVDPLICIPVGSGISMASPHSESTDWYAYSVMLMQSLLFVDPYGGIYRPKDKAKLIPHDQRPLKRITVFDPEVRYPKPAIHYSVLPDDLLDHFHQVFELDKRSEFPLRLIDDLRWTKCPVCGLEHARKKCPHCVAASPEIIRETVVARGHVLSETVFKTGGVILFAKSRGGALDWLYHEDGDYRRENGRVVVTAPLENGMRFRLRGADTLIAKGNDLIVFSSGRMERLRVDSFGLLPMFDANRSRYFWAENGSIMASDMISRQVIGDVLEGQTLFWTGDRLGFGFYRVGKLNVSFIFDPSRPGINDGVKLPPIKGQLEDSACVISDRIIWFFTTTRENGQSINRCHVIDGAGRVISSAQSRKGGDDWLSTIRGKCAAGDFLLAATDDGIVRLEIDGDRIIKAKEFPDTAGFVDSGSHLFPGAAGLYVVREKSINLLKIS